MIERRKREGSILDRSDYSFYHPNILRKSSNETKGNFTDNVPKVKNTGGHRRTVSAPDDVSILKAWIKTAGGVAKASALLGIDPSTIWRMTRCKVKIRRSVMIAISKSD